MSNEKREWQRFNPEGLTAHIVIDTASGSEILAHGRVIDMSYTGIKIRLVEPIADIIEQAKLCISLILPQSQITVHIHGIIKHVANRSEFGLQYHETQENLDLDDLMFECIKLVPENKTNQALNV